MYNKYVERGNDGHQLSRFKQWSYKPKRLGSIPRCTALFTSQQDVDESDVGEVPRTCWAELG